jgi:hypothetical protein
MLLLHFIFQTKNFSNFIKGNKIKKYIGEACEGGHFGPRGNQEVEYYWNLGISLNNKA